MDAAAPGITSPFQVGNRRKGRCQIHLFQLLKENKGFPKAKEDFAYVYLARTLSKVTYSCRRWMVFVLPGSRVETAKGRGVGSGCGASCSKRTGCSWTPVAPASRRCWGFFFPFEGSWSIWDPIPAATRQTPGSRAFVSIGCSPCPPPSRGAGGVSYSTTTTEREGGDGWCLSSLPSHETLRAVIFEVKDTCYVNSKRK